MARTLTAEGYTCCKVYIRNCAVCRAPFVGRHARAKYCKPSCKEAADRERLRVRYVPRVAKVRECERCGSTYASFLGWQRFCSDACALGRDCAVCGRPFVAWDTKQQTCGRVCGLEYRRRNGWDTVTRPEKAWPASKVYPKDCVQCGRPFIGRRPSTKSCSTECGRLYRQAETVRRYSTDHEYREKVKAVARTAMNKRYAADPGHRDRVLASSHARRADKLGLASNKILLSYLIERDHGRCGICHKPVRAKQGMTRPSIDHIIPLSKGGTHDLSNVQLAHYRCNLSKGNRGGGEQLLLVG